MKQTFSIIACDLDSTLLNDHKQISQFTTSTLLQLQEQGNILILVSGRYYHEMEPFVKQLKLADYGGYAICSNGYEIHDVKHKSCYHFDSIQPKEAAILCKIASIYHCISYIEKDGSYDAFVSSFLYPALTLSKWGTHMIEPFANNKLKYLLGRAQEMHIYTYPKQEFHAPLSKICFLASQKKLKKLVTYIQKRFPNQYNFFVVNQNSLEIVKQNVSKAYAVQYVCDQLDYTMEQVIAFGDSGNDEVLLEAAGLGVAMKNAFKTTKIIADVISEKTNNEDGVANFLLHHLDKENSI